MNKTYIESRIAQIIAELNNLTAEDLQSVLDALRILEPKNHRDFLIATITNAIKTCLEPEVLILMLEVLIDYRNFKKEMAEHVR